MYKINRLFIRYYDLLGFLNLLIPAQLGIQAGYIDTRVLISKGFHTAGMMSILLYH